MPSRLHERLSWHERLSFGTLRVRLAAWNTACVVALTVAAVLATRHEARRILVQAVEDELRGGVKEASLAVADLFPDVDSIVAAIRRQYESHRDRGWFVHLLTDDGTTLWKSDDCPDEVATFPPFNLDRTENIVQIGPYRYVRRRIAVPGAPAFHVRVGTYTTGLEASLAGLMRLLLVVGGAVCAIAPLAGWWLASRATRPVANILRTADRLDPTRLGDRLPVRGVGDELDHLAVTINRLLDDVAVHVDRQQQFVADAAHELRGPLAAIRSTIEVTLSKDRVTAEYRGALEQTLEEVRHIAKLANDLLLLAESGSETIPATTAPADLAAVARQAVAMFRGVAEDRGVALLGDDVDTAAPVAGDAGQLRQVLANLLDNAIRFTPAGGSVEVRLSAVPREGRVAVTVTDSGPGIAAEHIPRLFDRFYKIDPARAHDVSSRSGGLGLPICKAIVERHGGSITIASTPGRGTTVTVVLPRVESERHRGDGRHATGSTAPAPSTRSACHAGPAA